LNKHLEQNSILFIQWHLENFWNGKRAELS